MSRQGFAGSPISHRIADFAAEATFATLPSEVVETAKLLMLDALGVAVAATRFDFAQELAAGLSSLSTGDEPVIGLPTRLGMRDAAVLNGALIHGLDFDDTHVGGVVHTSASALPTALAVAGSRHLTGAELLLGYVLAVEVAARVGAAAHGGMHRIGFHPTGVAGAFGAAIAAGRLSGLTPDRLANAQGIVLSFASGSMQFAEEGAETKRLHPGWAAAAGITAAALAAHDGAAPQRPYEGGQGLYRSHLAAADEPDLSRLTEGLGERWELDDVAVKLHPSCHFTHAFIEAAVHLAQTHDLGIDSIERVVCPIHVDEVAVICEPRDRKVAPSSDYEAKFSLPFTVAAALVHRRFTLEELGPATLADPNVLNVAQGVVYVDDPESDYPRSYSGEVVVHTVDGRDLRHRVPVNRGGRDRPVGADEIVEKFTANFRFAGVADATAEQVHEAVMTLERCADSRAFAELLSGVASDNASGASGLMSVAHGAR